MNGSYLIKISVPRFYFILFQIFIEINKLDLFKWPYVWIDKKFRFAYFSKWIDSVLVSQFKNKWNLSYSNIKPSWYLLLLINCHCWPEIVRIRSWNRDIDPNKGASRASVISVIYLQWNFSYQHKIISCVYY